MGSKRRRNRNPNHQLRFPEQRGGKKFQYGFNFVDERVGVHQVNANFLHQLRNVRINKYMQMDVVFAPIINRLFDQNLIDHHAYHTKGNTIRGYFKITNLGLEYLKFTEL